jgi:asparagine synthase (glutamine-hydrolysing)
VVEDGSATVSRYWELDRGAPELVECGSAGPEANLIAELRELLTDSTRIRLRADVPVGAYVSGGLDSSITAALAQQCVGSSLHTFSLSFDEPELDESEYQLEVIRALGTRHHMLRCSSGQIGEAFPDVMWHVETPMVRSAPAPMFLLSRFVRDQGFKVVLTGEGADEFWGGYDIFKEAKVRAFSAARTESRRRPQLLKRLYPYIGELQKQSPAYLQAFFRATEKDALHPLFSHLPRWEVMRRSHVFFSDAVRSASEDGCIPKLNAVLPNGFGNWSMFRRAQYLEAAYLLPDYLLSSQGDRVAMAHSLEGRYPFLDYRLVEFAAKIPSNLKMKVLNEKYLLKQAFGKLVPKSVLKRAKQPYRAPQSSSFIDHATGKPTTEYIADMLSPERLRDFGIFDSPTVRKLVGKAGKGHAVSFLDNAALVAIVSTQSLIDQFIVNFDERLSHANDRTRIAAVCN